MRNTRTQKNKFEPSDSRTPTPSPIQSPKCTYKSFRRSSQMRMLLKKIKVSWLPFRVEEGKEAKTLKKKISWILALKYSHPKRKRVRSSSNDWGKFDDQYIWRAGTLRINSKEEQITTPILSWKSDKVRKQEVSFDRKHPPHQQGRRIWFCFTSQGGTWWG